ncbi:MAG: tetratricopeptide repeat protein [Planctomycetes bacterium]|nr:tetratricopeptide repeat protein [Planctomycetota bacterium]
MTMCAYFALGSKRQLVLFVLAFFAAPAAAQVPALDDLPTPYKSTRPMTRKEVHQRASLHQYALGLLCEREDRLLEALKAYEEAARLDPETPAVFKAQAPILLALDRVKDAQNVFRKALALDPADYETWFMAARIHKTLAEYAEARKSLQRGLEARGIADVPELAQQMYIELGQLHESAEDLPQAIAAFRAAVKILDHPDLVMDHGPFPRDAVLARAADTHERLGHLLRRLKRFDEALAEYKKAQAQSPDRAGRLNMNLAQLCLEQSKLEQALPYLDAYLSLQPLGLEGYELKVDTLRRLGRSEAVLPWLEKATRADANNKALKVLLAKQYAHARQSAQAENLFKSLAAESPDAEIYKGLFHLYLDRSTDGMEQALHLVNKTLEAAKEKGAGAQAAQQARAVIAALESDGDLSKSLVNAGMKQIRFDNKDLSFETLHLLGVLADRQRKLDDAEAFYRASLSSSRPGNEALLYSGLLRVLWKARKYEQVLELCKDGLLTAKATNQVLFYSERARANAALGRNGEALKAIDQALDLAADTDRLTLRRLKVRILVGAGKLDQAEAECQEMFKEFRQPGDTLEVRYLLSNVFSARQDHEKAEQQLEMILKSDPDNPTVNNDLGYMWADRNKNLPLAEAMIRKAIDLDRRQRQLGRPGAEDDGDNAAFLDSLGWVLFRRGQVREAVVELEHAAKADGGQDPVIYDHLGDVYMRMERVDQARAAWEKALHLYQHEKQRKMDDRQRELERKLKATRS